MQHFEERKEVVAQFECFCSGNFFATQVSRFYVFIFRRRNIKTYDYHEGYCRLKIAAEMTFKQGEPLLIPEKVLRILPLSDGVLNAIDERFPGHLKASLDSRGVQHFLAHVELLSTHIPPPFP